MLDSKLLGSLFVLVILSHRQAVATQLQIKFNVSLAHDSSPLSNHLQQIWLRCGWKQDTASTSDTDMTSALVNGDRSRVVAQHKEGLHTDGGDDYFGGHFYIKMDESEMNSTNLTNYTSLVHENGNITVTFYIPRQTLLANLPVAQTSPI